MLLHGAGLGDLVDAAMAQDLKATKIYADDSAMMIDTAGGASKITRLGYLKNAYRVIGSVPRRGAMQRSLDELARRASGWELPGGKQPFRVMFSEDGQLASVPPRSRSRLEESIARRTRGTVNRRGGRGGEYWVLTRRDLDEVLLTSRIQLPKPGQQQPGALRPDLANLLVGAAGRRPTDVFLDPFAGSGALVASRLGSPLRQAIYSDLRYGSRSGPRIDPALQRSRQVTLLSEDARTLPSVDDHTVDAIVTDPPWGEFEDLGADYEEFIEDVLTSFDRVLKTDGRVVMITARRLVGATLRHWQAHRLAVDSSHDVLVNGHPATVIVGRRQRAR
ncbi:TRM11 family SAM-dependent methyltransferase [Microlunatus soli]|uniref:Putative RNA methylase family UPF0020 n=1 Tax=Microlunatus soli TaxID=630515 RepID=A0A1H2AES9_9ACTN|nr:hypothetical protein [Microlunatus soli]SDT44339.1 Putative RNA methylase family UPF0020 [Microlunatus soli]